MTQGKALDKSGLVALRGVMVHRLWLIAFNVGGLVGSGLSMSSCPALGVLLFVVNGYLMQGNVKELIMMMELYLLMRKIHRALAKLMPP